MNESYVLKTPNGLACGYIMARGEKLYVRLPENMGNVRLTVLFEGEELTINGGFGAQEIEKMGRGKPLLGAYGTMEDHLAIDTGEKAKKAYEKRKKAAERVENRTNFSEPAEDRSKQQKQKKETAERRWPPPPCMPGAKYEKGRWIKEEAR